MCVCMRLSVCVCVCVCVCVSYRIVLYVHALVDVMYDIYVDVRSINLVFLLSNQLCCCYHW